MTTKQIVKEFIPSLNVKYLRLGHMQNSQRTARPPSLPRGNRRSLMNGGGALPRGPYVGGVLQDALTL